MLFVFGAMIASSAPPLSIPGLKSLNDSLGMVNGAGSNLALSISSNCTTITTFMNTTQPKPGCLVPENKSDLSWLLEVIVNIIWKVIFFIAALVALLIVDVGSIFFILFVVMPQLFGGSSALGGLGWIFGAVFGIATAVLTFYGIFLVRSVFFGHQGQHHL